MLRAHCSRNVELEASNVIADNDVGGSGHFALQLDYSSGVAGATHTPTKSAQ
jgi:hypothetical protein